MRSRRSSVIAATAAVIATALVGAVHPAAAEPAPAAGPASVKVSINATADSGRVTSPSAACERGRGVTVLGFTDMGVLFFGDDTTDRLGRWTTRVEKSRRAAPHAIALVPGDARCRVAQSRSIPLLERAGKAAVKVGLQAPGGQPRGSVSSSRPACEKGVDVVLFARKDPGSPWTLGGTTTTNGQGRYTFLDGRGAAARGGSYQLTTVAVGTKACRVGQSPVVTVRTR